MLHGRALQALPLEQLKEKKVSLPEQDPCSSAPRGCWQRWKHVLRKPPHSWPVLENTRTETLQTQSGSPSARRHKDPTGHENRQGLSWAQEELGPQSLQSQDKLPGLVSYKTINIPEVQIVVVGRKEKLKIPWRNESHIPPGMGVEASLQG